jgi:hypothetical protein
MLKKASIMNNVKNQGLADYFRTIIFYCLDFLKSTENIQSLARESLQLKQLLENLQQLEVYDFSHVKILEGALGKYHSKMMGVYSRYPNDPFIDGAFRRITSIKEMCEQFRVNFTEAQ